jgi:hypothetical protein
LSQLGLITTIAISTGVAIPSIVMITISLNRKSTMLTGICLL